MYISVSEIKSDISKLALMLSNCDNDKDYKHILCNINLLRDMYYNLTGNTYNIDLKRNLIFENNNEKSIVNICREDYLKDREFHTEVSKNMLDVLRNLSRYNEGQGNIDIDDMLDTLDSFLLYFNKDMFDYYNYLKKNGYIDIYSEKRNNTSETNNIFMLGKRYILFNGNASVDGMLTIAHEIGHAYAQSKIKDNEASYNDCMSFFEFYSSFMERIFINYLKSNELFSFDTSVSDLKYYQHLKLLSNDLYNFNNKDDKFLIEKGNRLASAMIYFYGEYLALIKEYDYLINKDETLDRIDEYLKYQGLISKKESLDVLGIPKDELLSCDKAKQLLKK